MRIDLNWYMFRRGGFRIHCSFKGYSPHQALVSLAPGGQASKYRQFQNPRLGTLKTLQPHNPKNPRAGLGGKTQRT